ncbi:MAG: hypothetical protein U0T69_11345 [Chitinophagales bacterium]
MRAIDSIDPAGKIADDCKLTFLATPTKMERWNTIRSRSKKRVYEIESPKKLVLKKQYTDESTRTK